MAFSMKRSGFVSNRSFVRLSALKVVIDAAFPLSVFITVTRFPNLSLTISTLLFIQHFYSGVPFTGWGRVIPSRVFDFKAGENWFDIFSFRY
jgi:hypothetical protein